MNLASIVDELSGRNREGGREMHVATMTLVMLFEDATIGELARDRIRTVSSKHPSRVIVLDACRDERLQSVEAGDWIELGVKTSGPEMLRSAVCALRLPDAPIVLLWIASGIGADARFASLSDLAETIVYNSSLLDGERAALCELAEYVEQHPQVPLADIAYLRLAPWQESVAIFFDGNNVAKLGELRRVEISCGSDPEAFYLLGWLASRLQWTPQTADSLRDKAGETVAFQIRRAGEPRRIQRIALSTSSSNFVAEVDERAETIQLSVTGSSSHARRYRPIKNPGIAALVERAILWGQSDRVFRHALASAGQILAQRKG
ncbi:MAG: glucose-6-phosphate dehydrogenase assembly protein OpcA [Candidatus Cybelea sp.]